MEQFLNMLSEQRVYADVLIAILRYAAPILSVVLLLRCIFPLLTFRRDPELWAWLCLEDGSKLPITHWENVIGRSKRSDIVVNDERVARSHGVLTRYEDGSWTVSDSDASGGILVNGQPIDVYSLGPKDVITVGSVNMRLEPISYEAEKKIYSMRTRAASVPASVCNLVLLTALQVLACLAFLLVGSKAPVAVLTGFGGMIAMQWALFVFYLTIRRTSFDVETVAFFLCTMGMSAVAAVVPEEATKQLLAMGLGLLAFLTVGWSLRDLERAKIIRYIAGVLGIGLLAVTLLFGKTYFGAKNWLELGAFSLQPSELSKVCFVFVGASTMDRLMKKRNLFLFIMYSAMLCGCLALMNDFGTALIFFCAFLMIAYLRSGNLGTIALAVSALAYAGVVALRIAPHALQRFATWRHIWEDPLDAGYQQTRALMCMVSGGVLGLGPGRGWLNNVFAADSDIVFATVAEEWGIIMAALLLLSVIGLALFTVRSATMQRSSFYTIGACTACCILLTQVILNVLGTVDVLPLTGVTFPFVSNGGSSMICAWGLLAFIKAADTRRGASFAVRLRKRGGNTDE